jgi:hypothetical protein
VREALNDGSAGSTRGGAEKGPLTPHKTNNLGISMRMGIDEEVYDKPNAV